MTQSKHPNHLGYLRLDLDHVDPPQLLEQMARAGKRRQRHKEVRRLEAGPQQKTVSRPRRRSPMNVHSDDNLLLPASNQNYCELRAALWEIALREVDTMTDAECDGIASIARDALKPERWNFLARDGEDPRSICRRWFWLLHWSGFPR